MASEVKFTLGADPEFFLYNADGGEVLPACGLFGGKKGEPIDLGDGFGLQEDNVMAEFNIPPVNNGAEFLYKVQVGISRSIAHIRKVTKKPRLEVYLGNSTRLNASQSRLAGAGTFGCSPDFDAYAKGAQAAPVGAGTLGRMRFAGGHVHFGYDSNIPPFVVAALADVFLGLPSTDFDYQHETRRATYGAPGRFRPTSYGIEYRVLSNSWIHDGHLTSHVGKGSAALMEFILGRKEAEVKGVFQRTPWADVRRAIRYQDSGAARELVSYMNDEFNLEVPRP